MARSLMQRFVLLLPLAGILSGCTTFDLQELKRVEPTGSEYQKALAEYYLRFAEHEAEEYDWMDSQYFAKKGLKAAYGKDIEPEDLKRWSLPAGTKPEIEVARAALVTALADADAVNAAPVMAARALFSFDCWVEQQEENTNAEDIAACHNHFTVAMAELNQKKNLPAITEEIPLAPLAIAPQAASPAPQVVKPQVAPPQAAHAVKAAPPVVTPPVAAPAAKAAPQVVAPQVAPAVAPAPQRVTPPVAAPQAAAPHAAPAAKEVPAVTAPQAVTPAPKTAPQPATPPAASAVKSAPQGVAPQVAVAPKAVPPAATVPVAAAPKPASQGSVAPSTSAAKPAAPTALSSTTYVVFFETNNANLTPEGYRIVRRIVTDIESAPGADVEIHTTTNTDKPNVPVLNDILATQRAEIVQTALIELGVKPETFEAHAQVDSGKAGAKNRRVDIFVTQ